MNLSRLEALVTSEGIEKIKKLKVLVLGLGNRLASQKRSKSQQ